MVGGKGAEQTFTPQVPTLVPKNMSWCHSTLPWPLSGALKHALDSTCRLLR